LRELRDKCLDRYRFKSHSGKQFVLEFKYNSESMTTSSKPTTHMLDTLALCRQIELANERQITLYDLGASAAGLYSRGLISTRQADIKGKIVTTINVTEKGISMLEKYKSTN